MQYTPNYNLKMPESSDIVNIADLNNNFLVLDDIIKSGIEQIMKNAYPVGSVYINATDGRNPNEILGFGEWQRLGQGRMMIDANSQHTAGSTGGAETVTLNSDQCVLPNHNHTTNVTQPVFKYTAPASHTHISPWSMGREGSTPYWHIGVFNTTRSTSGLPGRVTAWTQVSNNGSGTKLHVHGHQLLVCESMSEGTSSQYYQYGYEYGFHTSASTGAGTANGTTASRTTDVAVTINNASKSATQPVNLMPPYIAVYIWQRTA